MSKSSGGAVSCAPRRLKRRYEQVIPFLFGNATHLHPPNPPLSRGKFLVFQKTRLAKLLHYNRLSQWLIIQGRPLRCWLYLGFVGSLSWEDLSNRGSFASPSLSCKEPEFKFTLGGEKTRLATAWQVGQSIGVLASASVRHCSKAPQVSHLYS